jgi:membrane-bound metal-dependent hydrolase YbcI (DUF457 family)
VDIATHTLASFALARGFFPRKGWPLTLGMIAAGTLADVDILSVFFGPAAFLAAHRRWTHSLPGTIMVIAIAAILTRRLETTKNTSLSMILAAMACSAVAHVLLDFYQSEGVMLLWPLRTARYQTDWLPSIDGWILALLIAGILFPELFRLVGSEIGVKDKNPRGRNGAIVALALIATYIGARGILHAESMAFLEPRAYHGESARRMGSFPDSLSMFTWHGVVETESLICLVDVPVGLGKGFDPEAADCLHKPEPSPELYAAQATATVKKFLEVARFPRAAVAKTDDGHEVAIRSMRDQAEGETRHRVAAQIMMDGKYKVLSQELIWAKDLRLR